jgi:acyl-CoA synthetase (AMP-forming)/AMP-acid ligase II
MGKSNTCGQEYSESRLRDHLRAGLPAYMAPSLFVVVGRIPLTTNGKVGFEALAENLRRRPLCVRGADVARCIQPAFTDPATLSGATAGPNWL